MKKIRLTSITISFCLLVILLMPFQVNAKEPNKQMPDDIKETFELAKSSNILSQNSTARLTNEEGITVEVPIYEVPSSKTYSLDSNEYTTTNVFALTESMFGSSNSQTPKPRSSQTSQDDDGTYVYGTLTLTYAKLNAGNGYQTRYLLTNVKGSWNVKTYQIRLSDRRVAFTCQQLTNQGAVGFKYPSSDTFSYNTGFTKYAEDIYGSWVAAQMNVTCNRGTGKWQFDLHNTIINNSPSLGDFW